MDTDCQQFENDEQNVDVAPLGKISADAQEWSCFLTFVFRYFRACATLGIQTEWQPLEYKEALLSMRVDAQP